MSTDAGFGGALRWATCAAAGAAAVWYISKALTTTMKETKKLTEDLRDIVATSHAMLTAPHIVKAIEFGTAEDPNSSFSFNRTYDMIGDLKSMTDLLRRIAENAALMRMINAQAGKQENENMVMPLTREHLVALDMPASPGDSGTVVSQGSPPSVAVDNSTENIRLVKGIFEAFYSILDHPVASQIADVIAVVREPSKVERLLKALVVAICSVTVVLWVFTFFTMFSK